MGKRPILLDGMSFAQLYIVLIMQFVDWCDDSWFHWLMKHLSFAKYLFVDKCKRKWSNTEFSLITFTGKITNIVSKSYSK
jgi:hypothetical protein